MKGNGCHPRIGDARFALTAGRDAATPEGAVRLRGVLRLVGREKVNWAAGPREAGLGHDSARHPCVESRKREILRRFAPQDDRGEYAPQDEIYFVILSETKCSEKSRACA